MPLRDIPVFRSAYFTQRIHSTLCSKTLDLQVRCAHPTGNFAPKRPFGTFRCSAWLIFRFRTDPPSVRRCSARLIRQAETLELQPLRGLHQAMLWPFLQNARPPVASRPSVGGGSFAPPCTPLSCPRKCGDRQAAPPLCGKSSLSEHAMDFPSALHIPKEAWSFLRTPPRPAAKRAAATRAATPLPPPASSFFLTARSSFRTSRRP